MRALTAIVLSAVGILALNATADAQSRHKRLAKPYHYKYKAQPRLTERERVECARARLEDPAGEFKHFPCWAREAFARSRRTFD